MDIRRQTTNRERCRHENNQSISLWSLAVIFLLAWSSVFAISTSGSASTGRDIHIRTDSPSPLPTVSPLPVPAPIIDSSSPSAGLVYRPNQLIVYGKHFQSGAAVLIALESDGQQARSSSTSASIELETVFIDSTQLSATVPANIALGLYSIQVINPDEQKSGVLDSAYQAISANPGEETDLSSLAKSLWAVPHAPIAGVSTEIGLIVYRTGGVGTLPPITVDFYEDEIKPEKFIGRESITDISPDDSTSTAAVSWTPPRYGETVLFAVIDPENQIVESNESNNTVSREMDIRYVQPADAILPVAQQLLVNGGEDQVSDPSIGLTTPAVDPEPNATGILKSYYVELHWHSGVSGGGWWFPVKWSGWTGVTSQPHSYQLMPNSGLRYIQTWVADRAGNISDKPVTERVNYTPAQDSLLEGEIRVFRHTLLSDQCLRVRTTPTDAAMDPDIYVWPPNYPTGGIVSHSILPAGQADQISIQPTQAGVYQVEIVAMTDATYTQSLEVLDTCATIRDDRPPAIRADKQPRSEPSMPTDNVPVGGETTPDTDRHFVSFVSVALQKTSKHSDTNQSLYLPIMVR